MAEISPLFALDVEHLIRKGFYEDAIILCEEGLKEYPDYPAAIALLAKAYAALGDSQTAQDIIDDVGKNYSAYKVIQNAQENIHSIEHENVEQKVEIHNESKDEFDLDSLITKNKITDFEFEEFSNEVVEEVETDLIEEEVDEIEESEKEELIDEIIGADFSSETNFDIDNFIEESIANELIDEEIIEANEIVASEFEEDIEIISEEENIVESMIISNLISLKFDLEAESNFDKTIKYSASNPFSVSGISDLINDFKIQKIKNSRHLNLLEIESSLKYYRDTPYEIYPELAYDLHIQTANVPQKSMYDDDYDEYAKPTVITETIANILYQQGAIDEAIEAYQQLSELYPEKREYFINKIEEINSVELSINQ